MYLEMIYVVDNESWEEGLLVDTGTVKRPIEELHLSFSNLRDKIFRGKYIGWAQLEIGPG